ncbi:MAG: hypothetical protein U0Q07_12620 [Acidimicrobiales bacterium]
MRPTPTEVRHYWRGARRPFLNLSDLDADALEDVEGYEHRPFERYVEVQLWSDAPVAEWLSPDDR